VTLAKSISELLEEQPGGKAGSALSTDIIKFSLLGFALIQQTRKKEDCR
jgi:hypothetical protein